MYGEKLSNHKYLESVEYKFLHPSTDIDLYNNESDENLTYTPNTNNSFGLDINFKNISLGATFRDPESEQINTKKSRYNDYRFKTIIKNGMLELYYLKYKGFKIGSSEKNELKDITARSYGINYTFFIDPTVKAAKNLGNFEYDKKTTWGSFITLAYAKNKLNSDESLVPEGKESDFESFTGLRSFDQDALSAIYGIAGTFVYRNFYAQGSLGIGINLSKVEYKGTDLDSALNTGSAGRSYFNLGYKFKKSLFGIEASLISASDRQGDTDLTLKRIDTNFYYHYFF